jgi:glycosyltransferase involved in cell wall biosynthesis
MRAFEANKPVSENTLMPEKNLHIICLNVPYPADYGGVYDLFYKLPALQKEGVKIHLHCFEYGRGEQTELNKYCAAVHYYKRETGHKSFSFKLPYIVSSRANEALAQCLLKDDFPILMEGVHCTYLMQDKRFAERKKFIRLHNVEYEYYRQLFLHASDPVKKLYFWNESRLLKKYENNLAKSDASFWAVTKTDAAFYHKNFGCANINYLPLFLPEWKVSGEAGMGTYCLYHGNLEVSENEKAAVWLMKNVFDKIKIPLVIAGKNPPARLKKIAEKNSNVCLVADPDEKEMHDMIAKAHINILPSFNQTGIKLKLLNALYNGRHCVVNDAMVHGTNLENLCHISNTASAMQNIIEQLYHEPFTKEETEERKIVLQNQFNNEANAKQIIKWI